MENMIVRPRRDNLEYNVDACTSRIITTTFPAIVLEQRCNVRNRYKFENMKCFIYIFRKAIFIVQFQANSFYLQSIYLCNRLMTELAVVESKPVVGSSRKRTRGAFTSSIPIHVRFRSPPEIPLITWLPTCK